jgi:hydroxyacyl-ACP dehydratase HTD2-like protein with hotdog domain
MSTLSQAGDAIEPLVARPTPITLFRFSAVTWNPHRIHYDAPYAATEGYPGPLVQSHLHGAFLFEAVRRGIPGGATILTFGWRNRAPAIPGAELTVTGAVESSVDGVVSLALEEKDADGTVCATATASYTVKEEKR